MAPGFTQLDWLRKTTQVDLDTLDLSVAEKFGPFVDCTSNQGIVWAEASRSENIDVVKRAAQWAKEIESDESKQVVRGTKILMALLSVRALPHLTGRVLLQTSMRTAHDTKGTVEDALSIIAAYELVKPDLPRSRICIKIPSTWEGLEACRILTAEHGINTLATTMFNTEQAIVASEAGCVFVSPYLNELGVHFSGEVDQDKGFGVIREIFEYFESTGSKTKLKTASFTNTEEILLLAGAHSTTIPPRFIEALSQMPADPATEPPYQPLSKDASKRRPVDEAAFRRALDNNANVSRKMKEAVEVFLGFEIKLEELIQAQLNQ
ncbi:hypothetical protein BOTBODRAFT_35670 [Botryobasidium botryosum FD-172 SS1]|uniref:Transaldolase n=1 Tax=Botryobasidium botryosum (strain FD-172 SS1) TaxID=930990 RepID=A0A067MGW4_BOTB1|nr:hypothetical protein BOTBODRAFT_35670 [Botryobasidium botryosum FD-172 SS1]